MDLRRLQAFVAIAELKNFTKAAELPHIAQPALGRKIRKLEEDLEQQLFVRHSRGVMMTEPDSCRHRRPCSRRPRP